MNKQHVESVVKYVTWLMKKYQEIKQIHNDAAYKVIDVKKSKTDTILTIQISCKNTAFKITPQEIITQNDLLESFSKRDIRLILHLAYTHTQPKAKIIFQEFCEKLNKTIFGIAQSKTNKILKLSAGEISSNQNVLKTLLPEEALIVGYLLADEGFLAEKAALRESEDFTNK